MQRSTGMKLGSSSVCRLMAILCVSSLVIESAFGAIFLPTADEMNGVVSSSATVLYSATQGDLNPLPRKIYRGRSYVIVDDMLIADSDLAPDGAAKGNLWTGGNVYYTFDPAVTASHRNAWTDAAATWTAGNHVRFFEGTGNGNYIYVQNSGVNNSAIGMAGQQQIMNIVSWNSEYTIAHEIGHALGLIHEHQRSDRNSYVTINSANVQSAFADNFPTLTATIYGAYDFDSVMHYDKCAFSIDCPPGGGYCGCTNYTISVLPPNTGQWQDSIGQRSHLSLLDQSTIAQRYPQSGGGQELLSNGDFELIYAGWSFGGTSGSYGVATQYPHAGTYYAVLCNNLDDAISNATHDSVNIPSSATSVTLKFWLNIVTQETTTGHLYDTLIVNLIDGAGNAHRLATYSEADQGSNMNGDYTQRSFDVTSYRGQSVQIQFAGSTDQSLPTVFRIDDVSLAVAGSTNATLTVLANPSSGGVTSGTGSYPANSTQTISATANQGWSFSGWNDGNNQSPRNVVVPAGGITYTANFASTTPTPSPTTTLGNIATRLRVELGDNALIGGFIVSGTQPKRVIVRGIGPSLTPLGVAGAIPDPVLELRNSSGALVAFNDDWQTDQQAEIIGTGLPPSHIRESAIVITLPANNSAYTAIVRGYNNATGIGVVEAYDLDRSTNSTLANISTRGFVSTGDNVMIGGLIIVGNTAANVLIRAIGPSLSNFGVPNALLDPTLELHNGNGTLLASNDDWQTDQQAAIIASGLAPTHIRESAMVRSLSPGAYTAIVRGYQNLTGVALVEAYQLP